MNIAGVQAGRVGALDLVGEVGFVGDGHYFLLDHGAILAAPGVGLGCAKTWYIATMGALQRD